MPVPSPTTPDVTDWIIDLKADGSVDKVMRDRRAFAYDLDDEQEAIMRIRRDRRYTKGDRIDVVEADGYRRRARV